MRYLFVGILFIILPVSAFCQLNANSIATPLVQKPTSKASTVINTWKQGVTNMTSDAAVSFTNLQIVPANYQATLPQPISSDGLFGLLILLVHPDVSDVKPLVDNTLQH